MAKAFDAAIRAQSILVLDPSSFHRAVAGEMLRALGAGSVENASDLKEAAVLIQRIAPTILLLEWDLEDKLDGIAYTKKIRRGETPFKRDIAIVMASNHASQASVETARIAGVDEYVIKPFSTGSLTARLESVVLNRREFIDSKAYIGPDRRRKLVVDYEGARRRASDKDEARRKIALAKVEALTQAMRAFVPGDKNALRELSKTTEDIATSAGELNDALLGTAASSLRNYIAGFGADGALDLKVVSTHIDAMKQIVAIPDSENALRTQVAHALQKLVDKKLAAKTG